MGVVKTYSLAPAVIQGSRCEDGGFRPGSRSGDPADVCPGCGSPRCIFASDFKKFGQQSVRACLACGGVFVNGKRTDDLVVTAADPQCSVPSP